MLVFGFVYTVALAPGCQRSKKEGSEDNDLAPQLGVGFQGYRAS